jgi:hypothetical protein
VGKIYSTNIVIMIITIITIIIIIAMRFLTNYYHSFYDRFIRKLPSSAQGFGQLVKRYFVLKDNLLCYYPHRPHGDVFAAENTTQQHHHHHAKKTFLITADTRLEQCSIMFRRCWKIIFPNSNQTLWLKLAAGSKKEAKWLKAFHEAILMQKQSKILLLLLLLLIILF